MRLRTAVLMMPLLAGGCASSHYEAPLPTLPSASTHLPAPPARPPLPDTLPKLAPEDPIKATVGALADGLVKPRREWFKGLTYMPPYHPNHGYLVYIPVGRSTSLEFSPGEKPQEATCSDSSGKILAPSWSSMGVGPSRKWVFQVKVTMEPPFPRQDCTISTSRGIYTIFIQGTSSTHTAKVRWSDPYGLLSEADPDAPEICEKRDINYSLNGDPGAFGLRPGDIGNDGVHTCIQFPQTAGFDLPAVWLIEGDQERPASPTMIDGAYLIDGVPPVIELRTDNATLRIERAQ
jgi:hypothetical protein